MLQGRENRDLAGKPVRPAEIAQGTPKDLDRHLALVALVLGPEHRRRATASDDGVDPVTAPENGSEQRMGIQDRTPRGPTG